MVFWGAVVKPGKPIRQVPTEGVGSQLHLSQATLGRNVSAGARTVVKARVGDGPTIWLCSLTGGSQESVSLDLLFDQVVTFAVSGKASVHLTGYYIPNALEDDDDGEFDEYEDSEDEDDDADEFEDEDELLEAGDDDDDDEEEDDEMPEAVPLESNVVIQEVTEEEAVLLKDGKVQNSYSYQVETSVQPIIEEKEASLQEGQGTDEAVKAGEREAAEEGEEEDEDGFLLVKRTTDVIEVEVTQPSKTRAVASEENKPVQSTEHTSNMNDGKQEAVMEGETTTESETAPSTSEGVAEGVATQAASQAVSQPLGKKKRKAERSKGRVQGDEEVKAATEQESAPLLARPSTTATEKTPEKANGGDETQVKTPENAAAASTAEGRAPDMAREEAKPKSTKKRAPAVRRFPNGMEVEELALGKPDGRAAKMGKTVLMHYTGRLKSTGKIFDSNLAPQKPFAFRLGVGEVIKGWDVGVQGMRVGDKRKLTLPPQMGYGAKGAPPDFPGNAWLVFDVELVGVK